MVHARVRQTASYVTRRRRGHRTRVDRTPRAKVLARRLVLTPERETAPQTGAACVRPHCAKEGGNCGDPFPVHVPARKGWSRAAASGRGHMLGVVFQMISSPTGVLLGSDAASRSGAPRGCWRRNQQQHAPSSRVAIPEGRGFYVESVSHGPAERCCESAWSASRAARSPARTEPSMCP